MMRPMRTGAVFALAAVACQCLGFAAGMLITILFGTISPIVAGMASLIAVPLGLGAGPAVAQVLLAETRWAARTSLRMTILLSLVGLAVGQMAGAAFESGHLRGGGWQALVGSLVGSFLLILLANVLRREPTMGSLQLGK